MPRLARLDALCVLLHVMIRGIERRKIYRDSKDQEDRGQRAERDKRAEDGNWGRNLELTRME